MEETTVSNEVEAPVQATEAQSEPATEQPEPQDKTFSQDNVNVLIGSAKRRAREQGYHQAKSEMMEQMQAQQANNVSDDPVSYESAVAKAKTEIQEEMRIKQNHATMRRGRRKYGDSFANSVEELVSKASYDQDLAQVLFVASEMENPEMLLNKLSTDSKVLRDMLDKKSSRLNAALGDLSDSLKGTSTDNTSKTVKNPPDPIKEVSGTPTTNPANVKLTSAQKRARVRRADKFG